MTDRPANRAALEDRIRSTPIAGDPDKMRAAFDHITGPLAKVRTTDIAGIPCGLFGEGAPILWIHGGGLVLGSSATHARAAEHVALATGRQVVVPDYPRAPEAAWPAQLDACLAVLDALPGPLPVVGDSVGGQIAVLLGQARGGRIASLSLISPNSDRTGQSTTRHRASDLMNDDEGDRTFARMAMGDYDPRDPQVSPAISDLAGLPPTLILAAGDEILLDDALILARAAALHGVATQLRVFPGLFHLWPLWPDILPEGAAALDAVAAHIETTTNGDISC
ncbi:alpha/beta hydrolase fold domain-containing protein [Palleronia abyssalis]|uniref:Acetyl-hydrolase LipR n=1 Tax=Palleronia abyssalis TaxID=1501240 RepID=A0A2R8BX12_9RHOB|nr:alpha/beta hydrolase fold domain-containing protein [Palleronia abyssalis]SPJ24704.1 Putative acetyl-hydrolase LipR [Palleronia abyssalis]